jgi:hypothetical protein
VRLWVQNPLGASCMCNYQLNKKSIFIKNFPYLIFVATIFTVEFVTDRDFSALVVVDSSSSATKVAQNAHFKADLKAQFILVHMSSYSLGCKFTPMHSKSSIL